MLCAMNTNRDKPLTIILRVNYNYAEFTRYRSHGQIAEIYNVLLEISWFQLCWCNNHRSTLWSYVSWQFCSIINCAHFTKSSRKSLGQLQQSLQMNNNGIEWYAHWDTNSSEEAISAKNIKIYKYWLLVDCLLFYVLTSIFTHAQLF